jgi:hypothetical protein
LLICSWQTTCGYVLFVIRVSPFRYDPVHVDQRVAGAILVQAQIMRWHIQKTAYPAAGSPSRADADDLYDF